MRRSIVVVAALVLFAGACKKSRAVDDDLSSGRKPIASGGGSTGKTSSKATSPASDDDDDDDDGPSKKSRLVSVEGRFRVDFPPEMTPPREQAVPMNSAVGPLVLHDFMNETAKETFGVSYSDYPAGHVAKAGGASFVLLEVQSGALGAMHATLERGDEVTHDGTIARDFTFRTAVGERGRQFATLVGDRLYQAMFLTSEPSGVESARVSAFFASFHVTK